MRRWWVALALAAGILAGATAWAQQGIGIVVDGREITPDVPPQIINGRAMVPLRAVAEALDAGVWWDDATRTVTVSSMGNVTDDAKSMGERLEQIESFLNQQVVSQAFDPAAIAWAVRGLNAWMPDTAIATEKTPSGRDIFPLYVALRDEAAALYALAELGQSAVAGTMSQAKKEAADRAIEAIRAFLTTK